MIGSKKKLGFVLVGFSLILLIILVLVKEDLDTRDAFLCEAISTSPELDMKSCPVHQSNTSWYMTLAFGLAFLMLASGLYLIFYAPTGETTPTTMVRPSYRVIDASKLSEEEQKIYALLKEKEGSAYQSDLVKETGWSKVQVTRLLDKLESQGIVERKRRGMTNIVVLK